MTDSKFKFVTREEIKQYWKDYSDEKSRVVFLASFVDRLLAERDAYREVAMKYLQWRFEHDVQMMDEWEGKTTTEDEVEAEAARILEEI